MILESQAYSIKQLSDLASSGRHSILIEGPTGCGKSYLAKQFSQMVGSIDFCQVPPTVQAIRDIIDSSYGLSQPVVFCIENLDTGVLGASFTLLKFLEEPASNTYIVVTCRNRYHVPDTILSRSACVTVGHSSESDVERYAYSQDSTKFRMLKSLPAWNSVKTLKDVDSIYRFSATQLAYFEELVQICTFKDTVANIVWKLGHFSDGKETDLNMIMNFVISTCASTRIQRYAIDCVKDLSSSRIAAHAVLAKFVFECKYGD